MFWLHFPPDKVDLQHRTMYLSIHMLIGKEQVTVARVQLVISDEDRDRFVRQARSEGMTLSEWLRAAAHQRLEEQQRSLPLRIPSRPRRVLPRLRRVGRSRARTGLAGTLDHHRQIAKTVEQLLRPTKSR